MFLSIATTHRPATDLGFLLHKHPERVHEDELRFGKASSSTRRPATRAARRRCCSTSIRSGWSGARAGEGLLDQYVNDRPYAASSFLSVALIRTLNGDGRDLEGAAGSRRDDAAGSGGDAPAGAGRRAPGPALFEPLGWTVDVEPIEGATGRPASSSRVQLTGPRGSAPC